ncbi:hypothetical protein ACFFRR_007687 [Megaselia abdita]
MWDELKLKRSNFLFEHDSAEDFCTSQWQSGPTSFAYILYRWGVSLIFLSVVSRLMVAGVMRYGIVWFAPLTKQGAILITLTFTYGAILATIHYMKPFYGKHFFLKIFWLLHITSLVISVVVSSIYWSFLYKSTRDSKDLLTDLFLHFCNSFFMVLDQMVVAFPTRIFHCIYPFCFLLWFVISSVIYQDWSGKPVYSILDWDLPEISLLTVIGVSVFVVFVTFLVFGMFRLRTFLYNSFEEVKCYGLC